MPAGAWLLLAVLLATRMRWCVSSDKTVSASAVTWDCVCSSSRLLSFCLLRASWHLISRHAVGKEVANDYSIGNLHIRIDALPPDVGLPSGVHVILYSCSDAYLNGSHVPVRLLEAW